MVQTVFFVHGIHPWNESGVGKRMAMEKIQTGGRWCSMKVVSELGPHPAISDRILSKVKRNGNEITVKGSEK